MLKVQIAIYEDKKLRKQQEEKEKHSEERMDLMSRNYGIEAIKIIYKS